MKNIAIIPARSGSKGLKDKNIKLLNEKPLIAYSIEAAIKSKLFDEIHISTDSKEYAQIAVKYGGRVPFLRSDKTSGDDSSTWDVVKEVLEKYRKLDRVFDTITVLQPTAPLRQEDDIMKAFEIFEERNANSIVSVCEVNHSPLWSNTLPLNHSLCDFLKKENSDLPRQKLDTYYRINGAIYITKTEFFTNCRSIYDSECYAYIMKKENSIDIDDEYDFIVAEALIKNIVKIGKYRKRTEVDY